MTKIIYLRYHQWWYLKAQFVGLEMRMEREVE